ncbi:MAG: tetratricopeptide repeat protein [Rhodothermales bacterium]
MRHFLFATFLVVLLALPASSSAQNRVALLTDINGTVEVARAGSQSFAPAEWGTQLFEGDRIRTAENARTALLFANGNMLSLEGNASMTVSASSIASPALSGPVRELDGELLAVASDVMLHRAGEGEIAVLGGLRNAPSSEALQAAYPVNTLIPNAVPTFSWTAVDGFDLYTIKVQSAGTTIWSGATDASELQYPATAPALVSGVSYYWQVEAEDMLDVVSSPLYSFEVADDETAASVEANRARIQSMFHGQTESSEFWYVLGTYYAGQDLLGDAVIAFNRIATQHPQSASVHRILGRLYSQTGQKDAAIQALQKAVSLSQKD